MRRHTAGDFRNRVVIEQDTITTAVSGAKTHNWTAFLAVWASITPGSAREVSQAQQIASEATTIVKLRRYHPGITPTMRVAYLDHKAGGITRYFDIKGTINPTESRDQLWLVCRETNQ